MLRSGYPFAIYLYLALTGPAPGQLSNSAYRALGQPDLQQNSVNMVQGAELYAPEGVALDFREGTLHLYVSDTRNHRVMAWRDARTAQIGDPAALVLGQPNLQRTGPMGIGVKGFNAPLGLAVDPNTGNLYVADFGNNRVLRFPNPFANPSRTEPDAVYGQPDFASRAANALGVTQNSMYGPRAVAFDSTGNLWVADSGNHRILRFNAGVLDTPNPDADLVLGQKDFNTGLADGGQGVTASGFDTPTGLAFDQQDNLYVADFSNARVLKFAAPVNLGDAATTVFGQPNFASRSVPLQASASTIRGPEGLSIDASGRLYVVAPLDNRILVFSANAPSGSAAIDVLGQADFTSTKPNPSSFPYASASTFAAVTDAKVDPDGNLFVADTGNNRVISFTQNWKSAGQLWGQPDFSSNGINQIKPGSINFPFKMAVDYSQAPYPLYVSDPNNHRVLIWKDAAAFRTGDPADLVIGQPDLRTGLANVDGRGGQPSATSLFSPRGIAVDAGGNLYVADAGNHRVLRFPRPVDQSGRITADAVIGQANFTSSVSSAVTASSLNTPTGVAMGPDGNLFVSDSGNNRVLEFAAGAGSGAAAIRVYGQPDFTTGAPPSPVSAQTLALPQGIAVDASYTLYVADSGASRVVVFPDTRNAAATGSAAMMVLGQGQFDSAAPGAGPTGLRTPMDVSVDSGGNVYVSDSGNNRVVVFPPLVFLPLAGASAVSVIGQRDLGGAYPNWNSSDGRATAEGLYQPAGLFIDRRDTVYVGDPGNNRVVHFLKTASMVHAAFPQTGTTVAPGAMVSINGTGLSDTDETAAGPPLPVALANREVVINETIRSPLSSVSSEQIRMQLPWATPVGTSRFAVRVADTGELLAGSTITAATTWPGLFSASGDGKGQGKILNQDGTPNSSSNPAAKGSVVKIFGTGQGPVNPSVADGVAAPPNVNTVAAPTTDPRKCLLQLDSVCVAIGTAFAEIQFSGLAPGLVGMWELDVKIPSDASPGSVPLRAVINRAYTNIVNVEVK